MSTRTNIECSGASSRKHIQAQYVAEQFFVVVGGFWIPTFAIYNFVGVRGLVRDWPSIGSYGWLLIRTPYTNHTLSRHRVQEIPKYFDVDLLLPASIIHVYIQQIFSKYQLIPRGTIG